MKQFEIVDMVICTTMENAMSMETKEAKKKTTKEPKKPKESKEPKKVAEPKEQKELQVPKAKEAKEHKEPKKPIEKVIARPNSMAQMYNELPYEKKPWNKFGVKGMSQEEIDQIQENRSVDFMKRIFAIKDMYKKRV